MVSVPVLSNIIAFIFLEFSNAARLRINNPLLADKAVDTETTSGHSKFPSA